MRRSATALLLLAAALGSCAPPEPAPEAEAPAPAAFCRIGPDGGPPGVQIADRGIGGTGAPSGPRRQFDRGIGGTGSTTGRRVYPRTASSTGIVAVITGFASICLGGQEVALDPGVPVAVGDDPIAADAMRAGQVALVDADDAGGALHARSIDIRFEVSGPVEAIDGMQWRVAGQAVAVTPATLGDRPARGAWVSVSGLRRADGVIEATRLDARDPGEALVHGRLLQEGGVLRVGALVVTAAEPVDRIEGQNVTATGVMAGGALQADAIVPDVLASDPTALFAPGVATVLVETFATYDAGRIRFGQGFSAPALDPGGSFGGREILSLHRRPGGEFGARAVEGSGGPAGQLSPHGAPQPAPQFEAAPVPNHAIGPPGSAAQRQGGTGGRGSQGRSGGRALPDASDRSSGDGSAPSPGAYGPPPPGSGTGFGGAPGGPGRGP